MTKNNKRIADPDATDRASIYSSLDDASMCSSTNIFAKNGESNVSDAKKEPQPPTIFDPGIQDIGSSTKLISTVADNISTTFKALRNLEVKVKTTTLTICQQFGHTKAYCTRSPICVKCSKAQLTADCKLSSSGPTRCVHCNESHTANYRGCRVYQQILRKHTYVQNESTDSSMELQWSSQSCRGSRNITNQFH